MADSEGVESPFGAGRGATSPPAGKNKAPFTVSLLDSGGREVASVPFTGFPIKFGPVEACTIAAYAFDDGEIRTVADLAPRVVHQGDTVDLDWVICRD